jgi:NAD(P)-dependent dehydrogenase (short-subunit alcohol dehydrogenase family)
MFFSKPQVELMDLTGKVVFVTGARYAPSRIHAFSWLNHNSHGIGYSTVKHLALRGATVYLGARNEKKALDAVKSLEEEVAAAHAKIEGSTPSPGKIIYHYCDISTPAQAQESGENFIKRESRLDVLSMLASFLPYLFANGRRFSQQRWTVSLVLSSGHSAYSAESRLADSAIIDGTVATFLIPVTLAYPLYRHHQGEVSHYPPIHLRP